MRYFAKMIIYFLVHHSSLWLPCSFLRWKRGEPRKLFLMELSRVLQGMPPIEGLGGGVGLGVPAGLSLGVWTGVPLGVGRGLARGEGWGVTCTVGIHLPLWSVMASGCRWCRRMGERGWACERGTESFGGTVRGGRRTFGLLDTGMAGEMGWHGVDGVDGSDLAVSGVAMVLGSGFDLVLWRGFSDPLGLAGSVWVLLFCAEFCAPVPGWKVPLSLGLWLGDRMSSEDCGGMKKRRTGWESACTETGSSITQPAAHKHTRIHHTHTHESEISTHHSTGTRTNSTQGWTVVDEAAVLSEGGRVQKEGKKKKTCH